MLNWIESLKQESFVVVSGYLVERWKTLQCFTCQISAYFSCRFKEHNYEILKTSHMKNNGRRDGGREEQCLWGKIQEMTTSTNVSWKSLCCCFVSHKLVKWIWETPMGWDRERSADWPPVRNFFIVNSL